MTWTGRAHQSIKCRLSHTSSGQMKPASDVIHAVLPPTQGGSALARVLDSHSSHVFPGRRVHRRPETTYLNPQPLAAHHKLTNKDRLAAQEF